MKTPLLTCWVGLAAAIASGVEPVVFQARTARDGAWSQASTWDGGRMPKAGDFVQIRAGHAVTYDVVSGEVLRMIHVAGSLTFARDR